MKWYQLVKLYNEAQMELDFIEFRMFKAKGEKLKELEQKAIEYRKRVDELQQMKNDYIM